MRDLENDLLPVELSNKHITILEDELSQKQTPEGRKDLDVEDWVSRMRKIMRSNGLRIKIPGEKSLAMLSLDRGMLRLGKGAGGMIALETAGKLRLVQVSGDYGTAHHARKKTSGKGNGIRFRKGKGRIPKTLQDVEEDLMPSVTKTHIRILETEIGRMQEIVKRQRSKRLDAADVKERQEWVARMRELMRRHALRIEIPEQTGYALPCMKRNSISLTIPKQGQRGFAKSGKLRIVRVSEDYGLAHSKRKCEPTEPSEPEIDGP